MTSRQGAAVAIGARAELRRRAVPLGAALVAAAALASAPYAACAATYKWVDEKGVVHYTDQMPPDAVNKATVELNKQGVPVKKTDAALTPEQRRAKAAEDERRKVIERQQEEAARRDRALLASYTSEGEIELARARAVQTLDDVIKSSQSYAEQLGKRKAGLESRRKTEFADKPVPLEMERELATIGVELQKQDDLIAQKQKEMIAIAAKYDADRKRWRDLVATRMAEQAATTPAAAPTQ
jgi:hypothetical protein